MAESMQLSELETRIPSETHALLERAAEIEGVTLMDFVLSTARAAACRTVEQAEVIRLSVEDQRRFASALLAPSEPGPVLRRAAESRRRLFGE